MIESKLQLPRFRFSLRMLLVFAALCAVPCTWLVVEIREAWRQRDIMTANEKLDMPAKSIVFELQTASFCQRPYKQLFRARAGHDCRIADEAGCGVFTVREIVGRNQATVHVGPNLEYTVSSETDSPETKAFASSTLPKLKSEDRVVILGLGEVLQSHTRTTGEGADSIAYSLRINDLDDTSLARANIPEDVVAIPAHEDALDFAYSSPFEPAVQYNKDGYIIYVNLGIFTSQPGRGTDKTLGKGTDKTLHLLAQMDMSHLQEIRAVVTDMTDAGLAEIAAFKRLRKLDLDHTTHITDDGLQRLSGLAELEWLNLASDTKVTDEGVKRLQQALPNCKIERSKGVRRSKGAELFPLTRRGSAVELPGCHAPYDLSSTV